MQSLMGTLARTDLTSDFNLDRGGSRTSVVSRTKFFVKTVSAWESLAVVTKNSILVPARVLDLALLEIGMINLNKHGISEKEFH